ncbi:MAG: family 4C encapsulin nanocompartment shell protein [Bacteroidota bacterium]
MTIIEHNPPQDRLLDFINDGIRQLRESGAEAKAILLGPEAYERLRHATSARFNRSASTFETYQFIPIVVDPSRSDTVCVLPAPTTTADEVELYRLPAS